MKLLQWFSLSLTAIAASAQGIFIVAPTNGSSISAGSNFTVEIVQPDEISSWVNIGVAIGFGTCGPNNNCFPPTESLGETLLYHGPFNPVFGNGGNAAHGSPFQNFTVTIPADAPVGLAQLSAAGFIAAGLSLTPTVDTSSITLNIV